jgi:hypothetical protein
VTPQVEAQAPQVEAVQVETPQEAPEPTSETAEAATVAKPPAAKAPARARTAKTKAPARGSATKAAAAKETTGDTQPPAAPAPEVGPADDASADEPSGKES